ncbi:DUF423 domain-containing protein [Thermoflavifilum thermophilum]|uniref:Uncharacterized membrane protein YgdD, TMEM256/DUF423 family n=1 Tax=Thermoflavifilum thermophilum TaxID=1393122 RepID=A0A1I7NLU8_9BACT|nr:DUF423 domain-containing protein [Thermoflavifilum thermophilum]SFV35599.1 Uncharacterized membrane protein YgdD, TMEM256/DUF423 family [Thermoflavifilum thermophilum]
MSAKITLFLSCLFGALSVALGAFGAHILKSLLSSDQMNIYETAVRYQFYHSLALLASGVLTLYSQSYPNRLMWLSASAYAFLIGLILFCGSLYVIISLQCQHLSVPWWIGILTPIGGLCFILGWIFLAVSVLKI